MILAFKALPNKTDHFDSFILDRKRHQLHHVFSLVMRHSVAQ